MSRARAMVEQLGEREARQEPKSGDSRGPQRSMRQKTTTEAPGGARGLSERSWQADVLRLAGLYGWRSYHVFDSRRSVPGFPDLVLVRRPRVLFVELKTDRGRLTDDQRGWLADLAECTVETYVWRPRDAERIVQLLR